MLIYPQISISRYLCIHSLSIHFIHTVSTTYTVSNHTVPYISCTTRTPAFRTHRHEGRTDILSVYVCTLRRTMLIVQAGQQSSSSKLIRIPLTCRAGPTLVSTISVHPIHTIHTSSAVIATSAHICRRRYADIPTISAHHDTNVLFKSVYNSTHRTFHPLVVCPLFSGGPRCRSCGRARRQPSRARGRGRDPSGYHSSPVRLSVSQHETGFHGRCQVVGRTVHPG
jgi:hypothetical protein